MCEIQIRRKVYDRITKRLFERGKVIVLYGARQVGKTTLVKQILDEYNSAHGYFNCEEAYVAEALSSMQSSTMHALFSGTDVVVLDEAQSVKNIGKALKILIDAHPELNIIATGSSSFELANKINEPMTGRHYQYTLYPLSISEIADSFGKKFVMENIEQIALYGTYPEIVITQNSDDKREKLSALSNSYLYRDVFKYTQIKNPEVLQNLLRALAFQVGSEVSATELAGLLKIDKNTVNSYIRLLEQAFIVYRLTSYTRNLRNEIKKSKKIFFYDNGIVNALTSNFAPLNSGRDVGGIWENLLLSERKKRNQQHALLPNSYFWRQSKGGEIDLIEEHGGRLHPYEIKYSSTKISKSAEKFVTAYNSEPIEVITKNNFLEWLL
jgi:predicted AAA+ superfamily ATPase